MEAFQPKCASLKTNEHRSAADCQTDYEPRTLWHRFAFVAALAGARTLLQNPSCYRCDPLRIRAILGLGTIIIDPELYVFVEIMVREASILSYIEQRNAAIDPQLPMDSVLDVYR
jgi:hypothetical protein